MGRLVEYCPGDAPGSPAYLEDGEAQILLILNTEYCHLMEQATGQKYQLPHMGGECGACRRFKATSPS